MRVSLFLPSVMRIPIMTFFRTPTPRVIHHHGIQRSGRQETSHSERHFKAQSSGSAIIFGWTDSQSALSERGLGVGIPSTGRRILSFGTHAFGAIRPGRSGLAKPRRDGFRSNQYPYPWVHMCNKKRVRALFSFYVQMFILKRISFGICQR